MPTTRGMARSRAVLRLVFRLLHFIYFPDEFIVYSDVVVRLIFTMYYLPFMAIALALTHSLLQTMTYALIMPLVKQIEFDTTTVDRHKPDTIAPLLKFLYGLFVEMVPFLILGGAVITLGHKAINGIGDAMVDAFSRVDEKDYPLVAARLEFLLQKTGRRQILVGSFAFLLTVCASLFYSNLFFSWSARDPQVLTASWTIIASQALFVVYTTFVRGRPHYHPAEGAVERGSPAREEKCPAWKSTAAEVSISPFWDFFLQKWWKTTIHRIRHLSMELVICFGIYWFLTRGLDGVAMCVEVLFYLNIPHIFGFFVLAFACGMATVLQSFFWLRRHPHEWITVALLVSPQQCAILLSWVYFRCHPVLLILFSALSVLLWARGIQLLREYLTSCPGSYGWREVNSKKPIAPHIAAVLEDAFERQHPVPSMVSLDLSLDLQRMLMMPRSGVPVPIERFRLPMRCNTTETDTKLQPYRFTSFFIYAFPRLLTMQSAAVFGGRRFRNVRVLLRMVTMTLLLVFWCIVTGVVLQAVIPAFRPLPVTVEQRGDGSLFIDHLIVRLSAQPRESLDGGSQVVGNNSHAAAYDAYPMLCQTSIHGVSVWEYAWLSTASYVTSPAHLLKMISFLNDHLGSDWEIRAPPVTSWWHGFHNFHSSQKNISVIAVRGTDLTSFEDILQDVNMFFEVALYHTLASVVPGATLLPTALVSDFIRLASAVDVVDHLERLTSSLMPTASLMGLNDNFDISAPSSGREYYAGVESYVESLLKESTENVVLVGHSLGGAIAHIVATKQGLRSLGFSSPGIALSHKKFGVGLASIHKLTSTVISSHDIVPSIGGQGGQVHHIECVAKRRELCHAMEFAVGALWDACPSIRGQFPGLRTIQLG